MRCQKAVTDSAGAGAGSVERSACVGEECALVAVGEQPVVADAVEVAQQHVPTEAAQELEGGKLHHPATVAVGVVLVAKAHGARVCREGPFVAGRGAMRVAPEVLERGLGAGEGAFGVHDPRGLAQPAKEAARCARVMELRGAGGERKLHALNGTPERVEELRTEHDRKRLHGEEESAPRPAPGIFGGERLGRYAL